jgi:hypothetical protein
MTKATAVDLIRQETELFEAGLAMQTAFQLQGLDLLRAEMMALARLMPGADAPHPTDAETEAAFDNMPV